MAEETRHATVPRIQLVLADATREISRGRGDFSLASLPRPTPATREP